MSSVGPLQRNKAGSQPAQARPRNGDLPVATKIAPPALRTSHITRERLDHLVAAVAERKLTVLRAPGGFGKTTLALSWVEALAARGDAVAWLSLESDDNEPRRFLFYVMHALHRACEDIGKESLKASSSAPLHQLQALLINEIADCGDELFLFLDDYNVVSHEAIQDFVAFLLRHAPANFHLVLLSRSEPPLELGSLRARGELLEMDAAQLRFTRDETRDFLGATALAPLGQAEVQAIHGLTEGWPAALRITALSFGAGRDPAELLRSLASSRRSIGGFLDELCASLPGELLQFMECTAIVDRMSVPLCEAIVQSRNCRSLLERLDRQQLVVRLDDAGALFAYHQLLREYLLQRLERTHADQLAELHRRASRWYEARGQESESVKHLLAAGDTATALARIADCAERMVESGDLLTLLNWQRQLRSKFIQQPVNLQLAIIWAEALSLSGSEAATHISAVEQAIGNSEDASAVAVARECLALKAVAAGLADDPAQASEWVRRYGARPDDRPLLRGSVSNVTRYVHICEARWEELYAVPRMEGHDLAGVLPATYEAYLRGIAELCQARAVAAEQHFQLSLDMGRRTQKFAGATEMSKGPYAELLYETGRTADADSLLNEEIDTVASGVALDTVLRGLRTAARLAARRGQLEQALGLLERAETVGLTREWPRLVAGALYERLRLLQRQGRATQALGLLKRLQQLRDSRDLPALRGLEGVSHYCVMAESAASIDQNRPKRAVAALTPPFIEAMNCGAHLLAIRLGAMLARAHVLARGVPQGLRILNQVLDLAQPSNIVGSVADEGPEILQLLDLAERDRRPPFDMRQQRLVQCLRDQANDAWGMAGREASQFTRKLTAPLTPRERDILELVADGQSNKAIAEQLQLGPETVKTHLKNVFAKLEVGRRTQAALRARELGYVRGRGARD